MGITGHKTRSVFDRYDIVNESDLRAACGKLAEQQEKAGGAPRTGQVAQFPPRTSATG
jgi:hypothetical protein